MFNIIKDEIQFGGKKLELETGLLANQTDGSVVVKCGESVILATVVSAKEDTDNVDFFPLTVNYIEKQYAAGKIPGGFFKREGKQSERETLISRLIDRPIRPMFADGYFRNTQIVCTLLAYDDKNDPDVLALIGASAACAVAGLPLKGTVAGSRVAYIKGKYVLNPSNEQLLSTDNKLNLVVAGTENAVSMVESEAHELDESTMLGAVNFGQEENVKIAKFIKDFAKKVGKPKVEFDHRNSKKLFAEMKKTYKKDVTKSFAIENKLERKQALDALLETMKSEFLSEENNTKYLVFVGKTGVETTEVDVKLSFEKLQEEVVRGHILKKKERIDGRKLEEVRPINVRLNVLPSVHGSALFTRGGTQSLGIVTIGGANDAQTNDSLTAIEKSESFMLHYNFPPYSVGDLAPLRAPGRREIGHGRLAHRALSYIVPERNVFPYTIRLVSEIMAADGSTSMATVCSCCLAMMTANVPIKAPVAGVAMGLIKEDEEYAVLTDIMADEDHLGDMDFKVTGTENGITALQMDIKIDGITSEIMEKALADAKNGRRHILGEMKKGLEEYKDKIGSNAPEFKNIKIRKDDIVTIIGKGGSTIKNIVAVSGAKVEIMEEESIVTLIGTKQETKAAKMMIDFALGNVKSGEKFKGIAKEILPFGVIFDFGNGLNGMVHISEIANERINNIEDYIKIGEKLDVICGGKDERGRMKFYLAEKKGCLNEKSEKSERGEKKDLKIDSEFDKKPRRKTEGRSDRDENVDYRKRFKDSRDGSRGYNNRGRVQRTSQERVTRKKVEIKQEKKGFFAKLLKK